MPDGERGSSVVTTRLNAAIVGGGQGCATFMKMVEEDTLGLFPMVIIGVADIDPDAPGMLHAREVGVEAVTTDYRDLYCLPDLDLLIELTGSDEVRNQLEQTRPPHVRLIDHFGARLFWQLHQAEEAIIAQRVEMERRIKRERTQLNQILDSIPHEIVVVDTDMMVQRANESYLRNNNLAIEDARGRPCYEVTQHIRGECLVAVGECPFGAAVYERKVTSLVRKHFDEQGNARYASVTGVPLLDDEGNVSGMIEMLRDITDRVELEEELDAKAFHLRRFMEATPLAIFVKNKQGMYVEANPAGCELLGRPRTEILGRTVWDILPRETADLFAEGDRVVLRKSRQISQERVVMLGGEPRHLASIKYPVRDADGELSAVCSIVRDVTRQRLNERELSATREYVQSILDNAPIIVVTTDLEGRIESFNEGGQATFGYTVEEAVGQPIAMLYRRPEERDLLVRRLRHGEVVRDYETVLLRKDGTELPVSICLAWLKDASGEIVGTVGISRDISARRELLDKIIRSERLAAVGRLAAGVAHEINNPLAVISEVAGYLEDLITGVADCSPTVLDTQLRQYLPKIGRQVRRCRSITSRLLRFSRRDEAELKQAAPHRALDELLPLLEKQARLVNVVIRREYDSELPNINIDEVQFEEIMVNLITNAIQAMGDRGHGIIRITSGTEGARLMVSVIDDGPGIDASVYGHLFDPFVTTKPVGKGTGLGLSICVGIVRRHDGEIRVESEPGRGAAFHVVLPIVSRPEADEAAGAQGE